MIAPCPGMGSQTIQMHNPHKGPGPGRKGGSWTELGHKPPRSPISKQTIELHGQPQKRTTKFYGSKTCGSRSAHLGPARCAYRGQHRSRTWQSPRAAPQASPLLYTAREKDPRQGLRCVRCGRAPHPGSPILSGALTLSPAPHLLATSNTCGNSTSCCSDKGVVLATVGGPGGGGGGKHPARMPALQTSHHPPPTCQFYRKPVDGPSPVNLATLQPVWRVCNLPGPS